MRRLLQSLGMARGGGWGGRGAGGSEGEVERWVDLTDSLEGESAMLADVHGYLDFSF